MRDLALDLGISVVPDDAWGSEIVSPPLLHFAASTDPKYLICYTDLTDYVDRSQNMGRGQSACQAEARAALGQN